MGSSKPAVKLFAIESIFDFLPKSTRKASEGNANGEYPFFTSSQVQSKWINEADINIEALILGTGGSPSVHRAKRFSTSTDVFVITPSRPDISIRYVYYFLKGNISLLEKGFKGVGLKHISKKYLCGLEIPLPMKDEVPDLIEQEKLADEFESAEELKSKNDKLTWLLNELIPSLYSHYFNNENFEKAYIKDLVTSNEAIRTGPFGSQLLHSEFTSAGTPVLGIDNVVTNQFRWFKERYVPKEKFANFTKFKVYPGDVIVTIMGTVGRVCVTPENLPECMSTKHLCVISFDKSRIHPWYMWATLLYNEEVRNQTRKVNKGAIMEGWNSQIIKNLLVPVPSYSLQVQFADKLETILESRDKAFKQGKLLTEFFESIMESKLVRVLG